MRAMAVTIDRRARTEAVLSSVDGEIGARSDADVEHRLSGGFGCGQRDCRPFGSRFLSTR
jgi:hypothetical protein